MADGKAYHCYLSVTDHQIADRRYGARCMFGSCHLSCGNFSVPTTTIPKRRQAAALLRLASQDRSIDWLSQACIGGCNHRPDELELIRENGLDFNPRR